jgi:hypothetical protein
MAARILEQSPTKTVRQVWDQIQSTATRLKDSDHEGKACDDPEEPDENDDFDGDGVCENNILGVYLGIRLTQPDSFRPFWRP